MLDFLTEYGWILWLALILIFAIVEMLTLDFIFLMLGLGSIGGLVASAAGAPWWLQIIIAALLAVVLLVFLRPPLLRRLRRGGDPAKSNVDALRGITGRAVGAVTRDAGQARLANGDLWTARIPNTPDATPLQPGQPLIVIAVEGATVIVVPEQNPEETPHV